MSLGNSDNRLRIAVFARDQMICRYCGLLTHYDVGYFDQAEIPTLDHVIPKKAGGLDTIENLVLACRGCNYQKGGRTPEAARMVLGAPPEALPTNSGEAPEGLLHG